MTKDAISWKNLKLPSKVFDAYKKIQKELEKKHNNKSFTNSDIMKFFIYLAKISLELEGNPKIEGVAEPIRYTELEKLDANCQSVSNKFEISITYLRVGVLYGLFELAKEKIKNGNWKDCRHYLKLAHNWFNEYGLCSNDICGEEISKMIVDIIHKIPTICLKNPERQEKIRDQLFEELENIVSTFFKNPPHEIIEALISNELRSQNYDMALKLLKMALVSDSEKSDELVEYFLKKVGENLESEKYKEYVIELLKISLYYDGELKILETASEFMDVKPFYEELLSRKYLSPDDRFEIIKSMVKSSSKEKNLLLIEHAISMAKNEFKKQRDMGHNTFSFSREDFANLLAEYDFNDRIIELKFPDEVPTILYYLIDSNFEEKWDEVMYNLAKYFCYGDYWNIPYNLFVSKLFLSDDMMKDELDEVASIDLNGIFKKLKVEVMWWDGKMELYVKNDKRHLHISNLPKNVLEQLLKKLLESGVEIELGYNIYDELRTIKLLNRIGCRDHADKLKDKLIKKVTENKSIYDKYITSYVEDWDGAYGTAKEDNPEYIGNPEYVKFLDELGINLLDILKKAVNDLFKKELNNWHYKHDETVVEACINMLVYYKDFEEVFELIESENIFKVLYDDFKLFSEVSAKRARHFEDTLKKRKKMLIDTLIDALMEKKHPKIVAEFILKHNIATDSDRLTRLIKKLLEKGYIDLADRIYSEFGIGWMGHEYLKPILIFRFEKCIDSLKKYNEKELEFSKKSAFSLLRSLRKILNSNNNYEILGGKLVGRFLAWNLLYCKK